ncbi:FAD-dependent oxidoreductase [Sedimentisphaera salicampi]|uniref:FAD-dependent oxidoreductase n=1 Tax=Sedimentisphaera salicampi TaxID=1941349 RepID=UPI000B9AA48C|nr:FAD-dependent oxidoreductase [Sedimentisphaera salicampi]OXU15978.1 putative FAD-binding dehydrogenase [Sedimentisphaera salicampi]
MSAINSFNRRNFIKSSLLTPAFLTSTMYGNNDKLNAGRKLDIDAVETDVLVLGAGASGIPAAISAAREGARVVLLEEDQQIGGAPTDMYVGYLCGNPMVGIFKEMVDKLKNDHSLLKPQSNNKDKLSDFWYVPSSYSMILDDMISAEKNIQVICGARAVEPLISPKGNRDRFEGVIASGAAGHSIAVKAKVTIDATGNGAVCEMAGCESMYGRDSKAQFNETHGKEKADERVMPCTQMFISQKFGTEKSDFKVYEELNAGCIDYGYGWFKNVKDSFYNRKTGIYIHWGATEICKDTRNPIEVSNTQRLLQQRLKPTVRKLFESGFTVNFATKVGVRENRRIKGDFVITEGYMRKGKYADDTVAIGQYYLDGWGESWTKEDKHIPPFGIPYRSLIPSGFEGLLTAGKIISGTHIAMTAYRVQPIVSQTGQAAGLAAAMAAGKGTGLRDISVTKMQEKLKKQGMLRDLKS